MTSCERAVIVGGGVVGLSCALRLRQAGADVVVLDEGVACPPASWGNAGHIAIEQVEPLASRQALQAVVGRLFVRGGALDFRLADVAAWGPWALHYLRACGPEQVSAGRSALTSLMSDAVPAWRRLVSSLGRPELLKENGHWVIWESAASAAAGLAALEKSDTGKAIAEGLEARSIDHISQAMKVGAAGGARFKGTGQISDPAMMLEALTKSLTEAGGEIRRAKVRRLLIGEGRASLLLDDGENIQGDKIIIAAGIGSGILMRSAGHPTPLVAERGYHIEGDASGWPENFPPIVFEDRSMIVTRFGGRLRAASFVEFARHTSPPDPRKWIRLERHVRELGLPLTAPLRRWLGARPTLPDYLPAIGVSRRASNLIYAFGHQHLGLTLAATTGEIVAVLAFGLAPSMDISAFDIERFGRCAARASEQSHNIGGARLAA